jgi:hypothetical protein
MMAVSGRSINCTRCFESNYDHSCDRAKEKTFFCSAYAVGAARRDGEKRSSARRHPKNQTAIGLREGAAAKRTRNR